MNANEEIETLNKTLKNYKINNKAIIEELSAAKSLSRHNSEAMQITINLLTKENAELKRQLKQFIDAENWGKDTAGYEGEYK